MERVLHYLKNRKCLLCGKTKDEIHKEGRSRLQRKEGYLDKEIDTVKEYLAFLKRRPDSELRTRGFTGYKTCSKCPRALARLK